MSRTFRIGSLELEGLRGILLKDDFLVFFDGNDIDESEDNNDESR